MWKTQVNITRYSQVKCKKAHTAEIRKLERNIVGFFFDKYIVFLNICTMVLLRSAKIKFECVRVILNNPSSNLRDDSYSQETRKKTPNKQQQSWRKRLKEIQFCLSGHAMLCVGMVAPNGLPEPELMVKKNNPTQYTVSYKVVEAGEHTLCIRFGDEEVPGSPFSIAT